MAAKAWPPSSAFRRICHRDRLNDAGDDGFALADAIRARPSFHHIPIMFMTASVQRGEVAEFAAHGAAGYLAKPFSPADLRAKIDALLAGVAS
jgi:CheY-like chemotaxis protein